MAYILYLDWSRAHVLGLYCEGHAAVLVGGLDDVGLEAHAADADEAGHACRWRLERPGERAQRLPE